LNSTASPFFQPFLFNEQAANRSDTGAG